MIALDVLGGDFAPSVTIQGALRAARAAIPVLLVGPFEEMIQQLDMLDSNWRGYPIFLEHAQERIEMGEHPAMAVRAKPQSTLSKAVNAVLEGRALGVVSAGNSGALMVASMIKLGCKPGVERPAIAGFLPTKRGAVLCLDLGANVDCKPRYLLSFAHLGHDYLIHTRGMVKPRIGLLSNGAEPEKGSQLVQEAHKLLVASSLNFIGNVEPHAIFNHDVDIVICDGFAGNILLKTLESVASLMQSTTARDTFFDWKSYGGALLLGVNGTVVVAHGCSDEIAIEHALMRAHETSRS